MKLKRVTVYSFCLYCGFILISLYKFTSRISTSYFKPDTEIRQRGVVAVGQTCPDRELRKGVTYCNITQFLNSTTHNVIAAPRPPFLKDTKNPCFAVDVRNMSAAGITVARALQLKLAIRCLPFVYLVGFTKSGTTDLFRTFTQLHPNILRPTRKEVHFWDNMRAEPYPGKTVHEFVGAFTAASKTIVAHVLGSRGQGHTRSGGQYVIAEGTPRTVWHGDDWQYDVINRGARVPKVLAPHKIHHVTPRSRIIVIMRDPTTRLLSDYVAYARAGRDKGTEDFNDKVLRAIFWWKRCLELHPEKRCLYGPTPDGLPALDIDNCIRNRTKIWHLVSTTRHSCHDRYHWLNNVADRLRVGLYERFIEEWLKVFPKDQMLFIKFEEYVVNPFKTLMNELYPFLGLPSLTGKSLDLLKTLNDSHVIKKQPISVQYYLGTEKIVRGFYAPYNKRLSEMLGDSKWWLA